MFTYNNSFDNRAKTYIYAQKTYPNVMKNEFQIALSHFDFKEDDLFLNIPADIGLIKNYIPNSIIYKPIELNKVFSDLTGFKYASCDNIPLENDSVDKILSLATLHHFDDIEREKLYKEYLRILKNDGVFVLADVLKGSKQDKWLNEFVDKNNPYGHKGIFWNRNDSKLMEKCGLSVTDVFTENYTWDFDNINSMCDYCKNLFGLKYLSFEEVLNGIKKYLEFKINKDGTCCFNWTLIYFKCKKY